MAGKEACPHCATECEVHHRFCATCGFPLEAVRREGNDPLVGATLPGGYAVTELLDLGGMGRVYRAEQTSLRRSVAVKIIHPHLLGDRAVEARFVTEARAASKINHPNSVTIIDFGKHEGRFFIVMELLRGRDLASVVREEGPLPPRRAVDIVCQALAAVAEAHAHGIVHRDLKSENLLLEPLRAGGDFVKVLDFGLAQFRAYLQSPASDTGRITSPGMTLGTLEYMSPEQARGTALDHRSDVYSLGIVLYELLAGRLPFLGESPNELIRHQMTTEPADPRTWLPAEAADDPDRRIPGPLVEALLKALAKRPEDRHATADEFYTALRSAITVNERPLEIPCGSCGAPVHRLQHFCSHCGSTVARKRTVAPPPPPLSEPPVLPLRGRDDELRWLYGRCSLATDSLLAAVVEGAPGSGRTRLVTELLRERERLGDRVVTVGPDPWGAGVHWHALREAVLDLADLRDVPVSSDQWFNASPEARAGLQLLLSRDPEVRPALVDPTPWLESMPAPPFPGDKRALVAEALRWAMGAAANRTQGRVVVLLDDLPGIDGGSRRAFADLLEGAAPAHGLVLAVGPPGHDAGWQGVDRLRLEGIPSDESRAIVDALGELDPAAERALTALGASGRVSPLHLDQLLRFLAEDGGEAPAKLTELVDRRLELLPPDTLRVLQALAVLGDAANSAQLVVLLPDVASLREPLGRLRECHLVVTRGGEHAVAHPWLREHILAGLPIATRRLLHARARRDLGDGTEVLPIEAQALHAYQADEVDVALPLLERVAQTYEEIDDRDGAVLAYSRALELARRRLGRGEEMRAGEVLALSGKLADALVAAGRPMHALGVLREALDLAPPHAAERPRLLASVASAALAQGDRDVARAQLDLALRTAQNHRHEAIADALQRMQATWSDYS